MLANLLFPVSPDQSMLVPQTDHRTAPVSTAALFQQ